MNNFQLADLIEAAQPCIDQVVISKAVVKLKKLAKTIGTREAQRHTAIDPVAYNASTQKFYNKAYEIARTVNCEFVGANDGTGEAGRWFYLRVGGTPVKLS